MPENISKPIKSAPLVLFLDGDKEVLSYMKRILLIERYKQVYFSSPKEALKFLESTQVNVIISAIKMPEMPGEEFLIKAGQAAPGAVKLIFTGFKEKAAVLDMLAKGYAHYYLLKPWDDDDLRNTLNKFCSVNADIGKEKLQKYLNAFGRLPAPKQTSWNLSRMLDDENINLNKIKEEIEFNPFLAAKIMQIANSVSYGVKREIISIRNAVILIGLRQLKALVVSFELLNAFSNNIDKRFEQTVNQFWQASLKKAVLAKRIAERWGQKVDQDLIFISALLSNIGYLVWLYTVPEDFEKFQKLSREKKMSLAEAEQNLFFFEHTKLGAVLLKLWNIPSKIIDAVENHHALEAKNDTIKIIQIADYLDGSDQEFPHDASIDQTAQKFRELLKAE
ncbi:MAG TPA: HDOD domain-containing protein [Ignavibacteriaceae bacterium]|nr:HDOD domain-containing protein [Ignavibacteriaceae bacterium]